MPNLTNLNIWRTVTTDARGVEVHAFTIIGTDILTLEAFEPWAGHSTVTHTHDGRKLGRIGTRPLPAELEALPARSDERLQRVGAWKLAQELEAQAAIVEAFPESDAFGGRQSGRVTVTGTSAQRLRDRILRG